MTPVLSPNTQAILLLTAPLIAGRGTGLADLLSPGEYKRLAVICARFNDNPPIWFPRKQLKSCGRVSR
jgi:hypothetical protein